MENLKTDGQDPAFKKLSNSVGTRSHYKEKGSEKLSSSMVSPSPVPIGRSSFAEAKQRLKKLERDYQHTYKKYTEVQSDRYRYMYCTKLRLSEHHSRWAGYCISNTENVVEQLQNVLGKLNTEEAPHRDRETPSNVNQCLLMHGCKSLAQEKMILQLKTENKEQYEDGLSQETIDVKRMNKEFSYIQRIIPKSTGKKPIHDLLKRVKEIKKVTEKAIANGALLGNLTSQEHMKSSASIQIKLLKKVIRGFEKERGETENILEGSRKFEKGYTEKVRHLREKYECVCEKQDAEKKYTLGLEKIFRSRHKTTSQRKGCRKG